MPEDKEKIDSALNSSFFEKGDYGLPQTERVPLPEKSAIESSEAGEIKDLAESVVGREIVPTGRMPAVPLVQSEDYKKIESILEEDLTDIYFKMNPVEQQVFKQRGEETVKIILKIVSKSKIKVKKIVEAIKKWLKLLPSVNRFFLEQAAKIKADKIASIFIKSKDRF